MVVQAYSTWRFTLIVLSYLRNVFQECYVIAVIFCVRVTVEAHLGVSACASCATSEGD